jgi:hypothetical protein
VNPYLVSVLIESPSALFSPLPPVQFNPRIKIHRRGTPVRALLDQVFVLMSRIPRPINTGKLGMRQIPFKPAWLLVFCLWLGLIAGGYAWLLGYSFAAGKTSAAPRTLPSSWASPTSPARPQLLLALHPHCPCSLATIRELAKILTRAPHTSDVTVLMYKPASEPDSWLKGTLFDECRRMNCQIRPDPDGQMAASLGSLTSGQVLLYGADGRLRYQGGITASRGHEGDNEGERAVIEILRGSRASYKSMPVFGCPIQEEPTNGYSL